MSFVVAIDGPAGSGKGTIASYLNKKYGFKHISTGALFREKIETSNDNLSLQLKNYLNNGQLVPDKITNQLAKEQLVNCINNKQGFILDGYPRNMEQVEFLNSICDIDKVIYFSIDDDLLLKRITGRLTCKNCNEVYNIYFSPPKVENICDYCKNILSQRKDDNVNSFQTRMEEYYKKTAPIVNFFKNLNKLDTINCGKPISDVEVQIEEILKND